MREGQGVREMEVKGQEGKAREVMEAMGRGEQEGKVREVMEVKGRGEQEGKVREVKEAMGQLAQEDKREVVGWMDMMA